MPLDNPSNPHSRDENKTRREMPMPVSKARVVSSKEHPVKYGLHIVRVRVYGDSSTYLAPVLAPMQGSVWVPKEGDDVAVLFGHSDKPWVIGSWYAVDRIDNGDVDLPAYEPGDIRLGNHSGAHITAYDDGSIGIRTPDDQPVNVDHQSAIVTMSADQSISGDNVYHKVNFDSSSANPDDLFDPTTNEVVIRDDGQHTIKSTVEIPAPNHSKTYTLALFKNGSEFKRKSAQSSVIEPLSISIRTTRDFNESDTVDVHLKHDDNNNNSETVNSDDAATEFTAHRRGI